MIIGRTSRARVRDPDSTEVWKFKKITKRPNPNNPYTMDGTPAMFTMESLIRRVSLLLLAYSVKYMAARTPTGSEKRMVPPMRRRVPTMAGKIPPSRPPWRGKSVKNSQLMALRPRVKIKATMRNAGDIIRMVTSKKTQRAVRSAMREDISHLGFCA
jgi:hypothetical protein